MVWWSGGEKGIPIGTRNNTNTESERAGWKSEPTYPANEFEGDERT